MNSSFVCLLVLTLALAPRPHAQATDLAAARADLPPVPRPSLDNLERVVAEQIEAAERALEDALNRKSPAGVLAAAYGSFGQVAHAYEFLDTADAAYSSAAALAPRESRWPHLLGYLYMQTGRLDEAATQFARAQDLQPNRREAAARLADVNLRLDRLNEAREQFRRLVDVFPAFAANGLGEVALRGGRFDEAVSHFSAALRRMPQEKSVHYTLAMAYRGLGRFDQARAELERRGPGVIRLGDPVVDALSNLIRGERLLVIQGRRAFDAGDYNTAAEAFARAVAAAPQGTAARTNLGLTLIQLGRFEQAVEQFEAAFRLDPPDEETVVQAAILLSDRSRFRDAVTLLNSANQRSPDSVPIATTLARLLAAAPDRAARNALRAFDLATRVYETDKAPAHAETVALALAAQGRCGDAAQWMHRGISAATQASDDAEAARLRTQLPNYERPQCEPGGR